MNDSLRAFLDLARDYWRLARAYQRLAEELPPDMGAAHRAQARFATGRLEAALAKAGIEARSFDGRAYEPNLPLSAINADEFDSGERLIVAQMLEPAFVRDGAILSLGKALLARGA